MPLANLWSCTVQLLKCIQWKHKRKDMGIQQYRKLNMKGFVFWKIQIDVTTEHKIKPLWCDFSNTRVGWSICGYFMILAWEENFLTCESRVPVPVIILIKWPRPPRQTTYSHIHKHTHLHHQCTNQWSWFGKFLKILQSHKSSNVFLNLMFPNVFNLLPLTFCDQRWKCTKEQNRFDKKNFRDVRRACQIW